MLRDIRCKQQSMLGTYTSAEVLHKQDSTIMKKKKKE